MVRDKFELLRPMKSVAMNFKKSKSDFVPKEPVKMPGFKAIMQNANAGLQTMSILKAKHAEATAKKGGSGNAPNQHLIKTTSMEGGNFSYDPVNLPVPDKTAVTPSAQTGVKETVSNTIQKSKDMFNNLKDWVIENKAKAGIAGAVLVGIIVYVVKKIRD